VTKLDDKADIPRYARALQHLSTLSAAEPDDLVTVAGELEQGHGEDNAGTLAVKRTVVRMLRAMADANAELDRIYRETKS
jgi:hypothetical protein